MLFLVKMLMLALESSMNSILVDLVLLVVLVTL
jgi:hypothetical protein